MDMDVLKGLRFLNVPRRMDIITFLDQARMGMRRGIHVRFVVLYARSRDGSWYALCLTGRN